MIATEFARGNERLITRAVEDAIEGEPSLHSLKVVLNFLSAVVREAAKDAEPGTLAAANVNRDKLTLITMWNGIKAGQVVFGGNPSADAMKWRGLRQNTARYIRRYADEARAVVLKREG
jgi:hypothetical protein